jgi:flagellar basal-body rod modification protein FlgD
MVTSVTNNSAMAQLNTKSTLKGQTLDQGDFLKLLTTQMTTQDPTDPVDNKEMVAQMAQFSSLQATTEMSETLKAISGKLDVVMASQASAANSTDNA